MMGADLLYIRAKEIFLEACDAPKDSRAALIETLCAGDESLRTEVETLLRHDAGEDDRAPAAGSVDHDLFGLASRSPGGRIGRYTIVRVLGAGSMGVVYEAVGEQPKRAVALKIGRSGLNAARLRDQLGHEAAALARLQHPGIATVYDAGVDEATGEPYFAMELVEGSTITAFVRDRGLSIDERVGLLAEVCDAVHHAHLRGVIHRDLKPSNILVDASGRARVLDFGIARIIESDPDATMRTMPGQVMGTLGYMSPEQASGDRDGIDARTDIYALGSVAFELLAGRPPLDLSGRATHDAIRRIREEEPSRLGVIDRRLRGDLETIVATALEKSPDRRYQSAAGLAGDLRRSLRNEPIVARAPTTLYQLGKFARRQRGLVIATGLIAATLIAATGVSAAFAVRAGADRARAERRFAEVRQLANTFLFDIHDQVETLAGSMPARQSLVTTGLRYLDSLAAEDPDDPELLDELATAYARIADLQGNPRRSNLGDANGALVSYQRSIAIRERIGGLRPSLGNGLALSRTRISMADTMMSTDRAADGIGQLAMVRADLEGMLGANPDDRELLGTLGLADGRMGGMLRESGRLDGALAHFERSLGSARRIADLTGDPQVERAVSVALNEVGLTLVRMDRPADAAVYYEESMRIRAAAAEREPDNARAQRDLALIHHGLSDVALNANDFGTGIAHNRSALAILDALHRADLTDTRAAMDLSVAWDRTSASLADAGRYGESLDAQRMALALRRELVERRPDNKLYTLALALSLERIGSGLHALGRYDEVRGPFLESIALAEDYIRTDPTDTRILTSMAVSQRGIGEALLTRAADSSEAGTLRREAAAWFGRSLETVAFMERAGITPVRSEMNRAELGRLLAMCEPELAETP
jgi:tetratricopeptide (TPR) repeat protein